METACQRMRDNQEDTQNQPSGKTLGKSAARPVLPDQETIAPGQVQVVVHVVKVLPVLDKSDAGPCGQSPCQAEVLVKKIIGYGMGFTANLAEGQTLTVHFPMTLKASEERPAVTPGQTLDARLSQPAEGGTHFVMRGFTIRP
ncbi:hypothetical protein GCM10023183_22230 [Nibribacter koreensis]|uniref:Copper binding protein CusF n=2 Tax=Nibribacter koreensis TaxID=1084519 RepID=A0ABP8FLP3_9BACT